MVHALLQNRADHLTHSILIQINCTTFQSVLRDLREICVSSIQGERFTLTAVDLRFLIAPFVQAQNFLVTLQIPKCMMFAY